MFHFSSNIEGHHLQIYIFQIYIIGRYLVKLDENTIVDLPEPEQLEGLAHLGAHLVNTTNNHQYKSH